MAEPSPLRCRMIEDMTVRNLYPTCQRSYINVVQKFSRYFGPRSSTMKSSTNTAIASSGAVALEIVLSSQFLAPMYQAPHA